MPAHMVYSRSVLLACSKIACQRKLSVLGGSRKEAVYLYCHAVEC